MPLTDPVPSSAFDVLERNIQDTDKFVNQETGTFTNRVGKVIKPIPVIEAEANAAVNTVITEITSLGLQAIELIGWYPVGEFATGFTYTKLNDVGRDASGSWWRYNGSDLPKVINAGTVPSSPDFTLISFETADNVSKTGGGSVQDFIDSFTLKIFQSPTDGGLTEIQTRTGNANEVYEVRKVSDDSLATIYSDASGTTEIVQNGTSNVSDSAGVVEFYIADGDYYVEVGFARGNFKAKKLEPFKTVAEMKSASYLSKYSEGTRIEWQGYYTQSDGGSNWGVLKFGAHTEDGGSIFSINANTYIEANLKGKKISASKFGVIADWSEAAQNGTDSKSALQAAINYAREGERVLYTPPGYVRVSGNVDTNPTGLYKKLNWHSDNTTIVADFYGVPLTIKGGASFQTITGKLLVTCSNQFKKDTYDNSQHGVIIQNCKHDVTIEVYDMPGTGVYIQSTGGNLNTSRHDLFTRSCGRGVEIDGSNDDMSVITSRIKATSNKKEGIYVRAAAKFRQWVCWWYAENNWIEDDNTTSNYGVRVLSAIGVDMWIYSEQGNDAGEIFVTPEGSGRVFSARKNKDSISGGVQALDGKEFYQADFVNRVSEPMTLRGLGPRFGFQGEYVRVPFKTSGGTNGYLYADDKGLAIQNHNNSLSYSVNDGYGKNADELFFSGKITLTPSESSKVVSLGGSVLNSETVIGRVTVTSSTKNSQSGRGGRAYKADFSVIGGTVIVESVIDREVGSPNLTISLGGAGGSPMSLSLSYVNSYSTDLFVTYRVDYIKH